MNKQEIVSVLSELHRISGLRVSLHGTNFEEIAAFPENRLPFCERVSSISGERDRCAECDRIACMKALETGKTHVYKCHFGLTEAVSPLYNFGRLTGFLMMGQSADCPSTAERARRILTERLNSAEPDESEIPVISIDMLDSYFKIMTICAEYLTLSNAIPSTKPTVAELATKYIGENLSSKILIGDICNSLNCSKSTLLTTFKKQYGVTVNSYITEKKLELAVRLLDEGNMTISEIANETGFSDQSYFSKVFSAKYGIPPSEFRGGE